MAEYPSIRRAAQERRLCKLDDGRECRLFYWPRDSPRAEAKVKLGSRHVWVPQSSIIWIDGVQLDTSNETPIN
jgi:hypothetical protein